MRKYFILLSFFLFALICKVSSQNIPDGTSGPVSKTPVKAPTAPAASLFYQRVFSPNIPVTDSSLVNMSAIVDDIGITTQYIDGLGRPLETVARQASPLKKDFVAAAAYDDFGNSMYQYLPYTAQTNNGLFKASPFTDDSAFYAAQFTNENIYYGKTSFDASPLNKPVKQMAPGNSWAGSGKGINYSERTNAVSDSVRQWNINITSEDDVPTTTAMYAAGSLFIKEITDERGNETISYTDGIGRTILTKTQIGNSPSTGHTGWLCTYYVYDEMNHLRFVIPPKATGFLLSNSWDLVTNSDVVSNLCFSYWYDNRGRLIEKHIANKGKMYIACDLLDRAVMTQDENLRLTSQWTFIKYDAQSRAKQTGLITMIGLNKDTVINRAARSNNYPTLSGTYTILTEAYYDDYGWTGGTPLSGTLDASNINSTNFITSYNTSPYYAQPLTQSNRTRGSATGSKKLITGTSTYLYNAIIYDDDGRAIQTKQTNYSGGEDDATTEYSFSGQVLRAQLHHVKNAPGAQTHDLLTKYEYDHAGRLLTITKNIDGKGNRLISTLTYNELGQLLNKTVGNDLNEQDYEYNIRGWLTGINKSFVTAANGTERYFGEALYYDYGFNTNYFNGNIAGVKWKNTGDDIQRAYGFSYDNANRLTTADFTQKNTSTAGWTNDKLDFSVSGLKYDANGNITAMKQVGVNVNKIVTIDSLTYTYNTNSNQLKKIADGISDVTDWGDFKDTSISADDYVYDGNGNITQDNNKHIHSGGISYNFFDKPVTTSVNGKGTINYVYDAAGGLLQKTINDSKLSIKTVITYIGAFVYQKTLPSSGNASTVPDTLQYVLHEEGRIRKSYTQSHPSSYFVYDYFLKDHLGNIRSTITDEQDTTFYPVASLESATINNEKIYYTGLDNGVVDRTGITNYPTNDSYTNPNTYTQKLRGDGVKIGAGILLKVMAGDTINVHAGSWYKLNGLTPDAPVSPLSDVVSAIINSLPVASGNKFINGQVAGSMLNPSVTTFLNNRDATGNSARPNSWLNIIVLDEQLKPVITSDGKNSYFQQVGATNQSTVQYDMTVSQREITKSGYVYVYVSNESTDVSVYFDNLQVTHIKGPLLQEEGYYPFGLEMKAISSAAALKMQTNYKYNAGTNLESNFNVNYYETYFRNYDAQIGRFTGIDALAESYAGFTPYNFGINNPVSVNDPTGAYAFDNESMQRDGFDSRGGLIFDNSLDGFNGNSSLGSMVGFRGGGGGSGGNGGFLGNIVNQLSNGQYGGTWNADEGVSYFETGNDAMNAGIAYMNQFNCWGKYDGWATSAIDAQGKYNLYTIGIDPNNLNSSFSLVGNRIPDVTVRFDKVIEYTKDYFSTLSNILGNRFLGDWDFFADGVFAYLVKPNAKFDLKNSNDPFLGFSLQALNGYNIAKWHGATLGVADFGNYNFGVAANAFGLSLTFALKAAGAAQLIWDRPHADWWNVIGMGDEYRDSEMITLGYLGVRP